ncbi:hypothetical protein M378DRAFT_181826 [Amanita muscaria Koide BX008]|uniref:Uncharacterized protein n=1 Tax=Amanita muscaria (strain Koide BX008) TaxID=946122 RepID=A0A0C2WL26_AMAMK|nr:hypothetical protein M378DRAFT_181826 [Amanita muscaria Koide BX008]
MPVVKRTTRSCHATIQTILDYPDVANISDGEALSIADSVTEPDDDDDNEINQASENASITTEDQLFWQYTNFPQNQLALEEIQPDHPLFVDPDVNGHGSGSKHEDKARHVPVPECKDVGIQTEEEAKLENNCEKHVSLVSKVRVKLFHLED